MQAAVSTLHPTQADACWLTLEQGAARVRLHVATLRREIQSGRLRHARVGGRKAIRLRPEWLDAWPEADSTPIGANRYALSELDLPQMAAAGMPGGEGSKE
jgi:excisionase family DNA binding protein